MLYPICVNDLIKHYTYIYIHIYTYQSIYLTLVLAMKESTCTCINTYTQIFNGMIRKDHY